MVNVTWAGLICPTLAPFSPNPDLTGHHRPLYRRVMRAAPAPRRRTARALGWATTTGAAGWGATRYVHSGAHVVAVPAALLPFALAPGIVGLALLAAARSRPGVVVSGLVISALIATQLPLYVGSGSPGTGNLTVLSFNMKFGMGDAASVVALARSSQADVVALEEMTYAALERLTAAGLTQTFPYTVVAPGASSNGVGLFSRHPLLDTEQLTGWPLGAVSARLDLGPGAPSPRVYAVHVPAPWPQNDGLWRAQLDAFRLPPLDAGPVVVAGDFNSTTDHEPFRVMLTRTGLDDAADRSGAGWTRTYPSDRAFPPIIAIDHVLIRSMAAAWVHTVTISGSDHRAVIAVLRAL